MAARSPFRNVLAALRVKRRSPDQRILFTKQPLSPEATLLFRAGLILALFGTAMALFWFDREGLRDNLDDELSFVDVLYFTMVTITTVGYGDIVPVTDQARFIDAVFVTPIRIFVWFIFLGTAYQFLIQKVIEDFRMTRLQEKLRGHVLVVGYGGAGTTAARELQDQGVPPQEVVVIDQEEQRVRAAAARGFIGLQGEASREELLRVAGAERARAAILALGRDDTTILTILTLRNLNPGLRIIATVQEPENRKLLKGGGADVLVAPFQVGGFLLADAVTSGDTANLLTDLLSVGGEIAVGEFTATEAEVGRPVRSLPDKLVLSVRRQGRSIRFWEDPALAVEVGDVLVAVTPNRKRPAAG